MYWHSLRISSDREVHGGAHSLSSIVFIVGDLEFPEGIGFNTEPTAHLEYSR